MFTLPLSYTIVKSTRDWFRKIDEFIEEGNLPEINNELEFIDEIMVNLSKELGIEKKDKKCQLTLSLSPSITIDIDDKTIRNLVLCQENGQVKFAFPPDILTH